MAGLLVDETCGAKGLDGVVDVGDIAQADDAPLTVRADDQRRIIRGLRDLVVGGDVGSGGVVGDLALGTVGVLLADDAGYILQAQAIAVELLRIGVHAHRGQGAADDLNLAHAFNLR